MVAFVPLGIKAVASLDWDLCLEALLLPHLMMKSLPPQTLVFSLRYSDFSSWYFLLVSSPSVSMWGRNLWQIVFSSSDAWIKFLRIAIPGIAMKISESQFSSISQKALYFLDAFSMAELKDYSYNNLSVSIIWSLVSDHAFSRSFITSASSWLFLSIGSTTSIFSPYLRISILKTWKVLFTCSAIFLTARDWLEESLEERTSSHLTSRSYLKSHLPFPWMLVTGLISQILSINWSLSVFSSPWQSSPLSIAYSYFS